MDVFECHLSVCEHCGVLQTLRKDAHVNAEIGRFFHRQLTIAQRLRQNAWKWQPKIKVQRVQRAKNWLDYAAGGGSTAHAHGLHMQRFRARSLISDSDMGSPSAERKFPRPGADLDSPIHHATQHVKHSFSLAHRRLRPQITHLHSLHTHFRAPLPLPLPRVDARVH